MTMLARVACVAGVLVALWFGLQAAGDLALTGFPDSHLTDYDKAAALPKRILLYTEFAFVPVFVLLAVRTRRLWTLVALAALGVVVLAQQVGVPWYFGTHLGLDNGIGG
jgi:hypothetical protein